MRTIEWQKITPDGTETKTITEEVYANLTSPEELRFWRRMCHGKMRVYRRFGEVIHIVRRDPMGRKHIDLFSFSNY